MTDATREALTARIDAIARHAAGQEARGEASNVVDWTDKAGTTTRRAYWGKPGNEYTTREVPLSEVLAELEKHKTTIADLAATQLENTGRAFAFEPAVFSAAARLWPIREKLDGAGWLSDWLAWKSFRPWIGGPIGPRGNRFGPEDTRPSTREMAREISDEVEALVLARDPLDAHRTQVNAITDGHTTKAELASVWQEVAAYLRADNSDAPATQADFDALESATLAAVNEWREKLAALGDATDDTLHAAFRGLIEKKHAKTATRERSKTPWATWRLVSKRCGAPPWFEWLTEAVWRGEVWPLARKHPALTMPVHSGITALFTVPPTIDEVNRQRTMVFPNEHGPSVLIGAIEAEAHELVVRGTKSFRSITAHRWIRWLVYEGLRRLVAGVRDFRVIRIESGGWRGLAREIGLPDTDKAANELRSIAHAHAYTRIDLPNGDAGNIISLREPARGIIEITIGTTLLPHLANTGRRGTDDRVLIPLVDTPPLIGRQNEYGQQATLSMLVVELMRQRAHELWKEDTVSIDDGDWRRLATRAQLPTKLTPKVVERWTRDDKDGPAFLEQHDNGRFRLAKTYERAHRFIVEAGELSAKASEAGKKSVQKRRAQIEGRRGQK